MLAWRPGLLPALLPELAPAFQDLLATGDWAVMDAARRAALTRLREMAAGLNTLLEARLTPPRPPGSRTNSTAATWRRWGCEAENLCRVRPTHHELMAMAGTEARPTNLFMLYGPIEGP